MHKSHRPVILIVAVLALIALLVVGCGGSSSSTNQQAQQQQQGEQKAEQPNAEKPQQVQQVGYATFSQGGSWFLVGGAAAEMVKKYAPGIQITAMPSSGVLENIQRLMNKEVEMCVSQPGEAYFAYKGEGVWKEPLPDLRQMWSWDVPGQITGIALKKSGIKSFKDLKGKIVSVGMPNSATIVNTKDMLKVFDMTFDDIVPRYYGLTESFEGLKDGTIDAMVISLTAPASGIMDIATTQEVNFLGLDTDDEKKKCEELFPYYRVVKLEPDVYRGIREGGQYFAAHCAVTITRADVDDQIVYDVTKAIFDHLDEFAKFHPVAAGHSLEGAVRQIVVPLHPGAEKYFKEKGVLK